MAGLGAIDLCCGMGGLSHAALKKGLEIWTGIDLAADALSTYRHNFPQAVAIRGDIGQCLSPEDPKNGSTNRDSTLSTFSQVFNMLDVFFLILNIDPFAKHQSMFSHLCQRSVSTPTVTYYARFCSTM